MQGGAPVVVRQVQVDALQVQPEVEGGRKPENHKVKKSEIPNFPKIENSGKLEIGGGGRLKNPISSFVDRKSENF